MSRRKKPSGRPEAAYRRRPGKRAPKRVIRVFCDARKTEPEYFKALRRLTRGKDVHLDVRKEIGGVLNLVSRAVEDRRDPDPDEVWCVFDVEGPGAGIPLGEAIQQTRNGCVELAVSNPAFEYWYLLHFEKTDRLFHDAVELINYLRKHIPDYDKSKPVFEQVLQKRTKQASENARLLRASREGHWDGFGNPSTSVDRLVERILSAERRDK